MVVETYKNVASNREGDYSLRREAGAQRPSEGTTEEFGENQRKQEIHAETIGELLGGMVS